MQSCGLPAREPEQGLQPLNGRFKRLHVPALPFGNRTRMNSESGGQLPPCQPGGDPTCPELKREAGRRWLERIIAQEGDDLWHVLNLRIEPVLLPIVDRGGPNPD